MPDGRLGAAERAEVLVVAIVMAVALVGLTLQPLLAPPSVRALVTAVDAESLTGIGRDATLEAAESVRRFVVDRAAPGLPAAIGGKPAFDEAAVSHLVDVRDVIIPARWATLALVLASALWAAVRTRTLLGRRLLARVLAISAGTLLVGAGLVVLAGVADFGALFAWFHGLFFTPGTWVFPPDALLIRVFPLPFWIRAGAVWGTLVLLCAAVLYILSRRLRFTRGTYGV
jgi:integral membrane protein (TIGR01906 family)